MNFIYVNWIQLTLLVMSENNNIKIMQNGDEPVKKLIVKKLNWYDHLSKFAWDFYYDPSYANARRVTLVTLSGPIAIIFFSVLFKFRQPCQ